MIDGVVIKELKTYPDERGFFREIIRATDDFFAEGFAQWSQSKMFRDVIKAWHIHQQQVDWWYVPMGCIKTVLHDLRPESPTYRQTQEILMGEDFGEKVVKIPPGVAHGCRVLSGEAYLFYITSKTYNPQDEGRIPHDDPAIGYDWLKRVAIT
ncbi:MAG: dTDP-4-dehydrorhamnose 3,5-epimerase family protein [Chloroflexi bacterium]|nr:dTDP-4-dehydrorhamnose 3,5-epimerase family protein [Chloroflexota bacterium]MBI3731930.1 dTDP-4-dehydrorhamnose 3,5-epimerase family protein [Chloroflexota bacterium]